MGITYFLGFPKVSIRPMGLKPVLGQRFTHLIFRGNMGLNFLNKDEG